MDWSVETTDFRLIAGAAALSAIVSFAASMILLRINPLIDSPNGRSSHAAPASRAGGVAIFMGWLAGVTAFNVLRNAASGPAPAIDPGVLGLLAGAGLSFAAGLLDDAKSQRASVKLGAQLAAAIAFVALAGALRSAPAPFLGFIELGPFASVVTVFWIVAFMNAYNFMDGLNGIAASCAGAGLAAMAVAAAVSGLAPIAVLCLLSAAALAGFLPINMRTGRLFMGDSGSQFAGFLIAALAVLIANGSAGGVSIYFVPVVFAPFLFDVTFTLADRMRRRQNIFSAHREHIYQRLAHGGLGHATVTGLYFGLTAFSIAVATLMALLPPQDQWIAPAALLICLAGPAFLLSRRRGEASAGAGD